MLNQISFVCSPKHYKIISFFVERVLEKWIKCMRKLHFMILPILGVGVALSDLQ